MNKTNNTIAGLHILEMDGKTVTNVNAEKEFFWNIPKRFRGKNIQPGDVVRVDTVKGMKKVLVTRVFREEIAETGKRYKKVFAVLHQTKK